jgi:uncharacterized protein YaiL (DUF2058 family)
MNQTKKVPPCVSKHMAMLGSRGGKLGSKEDKARAGQVGGTKRWMLHRQRKAAEAQAAQAQASHAEKLS